MTSTPVPIELVSELSMATPQRRSIVWGDHRTGHGVVTDLDWHLTAFGEIPPGALTLARTGAAIFLADRATRRNELRQRRQIHLIVPVPDPDLAKNAADSLAALARFVTGDDWLFEFEPDSSPIADETAEPKFAAMLPVNEVSLLSGGLDSYCGALIGGVTDRLFLSHSDASVIKFSQNNTIGQIPGFRADEQHVTVRFAARQGFNREPSRRSRSILFMAFGVALAATAKADTLEVPENGFTSLNPPLAANRGGVLTTRSTHPYTFHLTKQVIEDLELSVVLRNPYEWSTKGELVAAAVNAVGAATVKAGMKDTMSCAKSNLILKGKTFGRNCGLDYACIVRRAGIQAAGLADTTVYECHTAGLVGDVRAARAKDVRAVELAMLETPSMTKLLASCGPFPPGYDHERALDLWRRGHDEICNLDLS